MPTPPMPTKCTRRNVPHDVAVGGQADAASCRHLHAALSRWSPRLRAWPACARPRPSPAVCSRSPSSRCSMLRELGGVEAVLLHQFRGARGNETLAIARLVVVHRMRERHQHRAEPGRRQLGQRQRTRAADRQIGSRIGLRHVVDEGFDARLDLHARIRGTGRFQVRGAALMQHVGTLRFRNQRRARAAHARFKARAPRLPPSTSKRGRCRATRNVRPATATRRSSRAPDCRPIRRSSSAGRHPAKPASTRCAMRASTRLVKPGTRFCSCTSSGRRSQPRRDAAGAGDVTAHRQHAARLYLAQHAQRGEQRTQHHPRRSDARLADSCRATPDTGTVCELDPLRPAPACVSMPPAAPSHITGTLRARRPRPRPGPGRCGRRCRRP